MDRGAVDVLELAPADLLPRVATPSALAEALELGGVVIVLDGGAPADDGLIDVLTTRVALLPAVLVGTHGGGPPPAHLQRLCDVVVPAGDAAVDEVITAVARNPLAATSLALHLRGADDRSAAQGLVAESSVYSTLQAGPEFASWRRGRAPRRRPPASGPAVAMTRTGARLDLVLRRPETRNALSAELRDALLEALSLPAVDVGIEEVHLRGEGPSFCSGGDLDEFGTFPDPGSAHLVRLAASVGWAIHAVRRRVVAHLHGACVGSGIELPAFAGRVVAEPSTSITLPEVRLGLIPGAGGTVSLPRRIGRHRTALLALTGTPIDAETALRWGLVDEIER